MGVRPCFEDSKVTLSRTSRLLVSFIALMIVIWSFFDVGRRSYNNWQQNREKPITLTLLHWLKDSRTSCRRVANKYMAAHPNVQIVPIVVPDSGALEAKFKTMISAKEPPDLLYLPPDLLPRRRRVQPCPADR